MFEVSKSASQTCDLRYPSKSAVMGTEKPRRSLNSGLNVPVMALVLMPSKLGSLYSQKTEGAAAEGTQSVSYLLYICNKQSLLLTTCCLTAGLHNNFIGWWGGPGGIPVL